ncbi:regulatory protein RecX [Aminicella lysinilytica]|uniref:Regulatory protein RecX n=1 Tax=Aminicella lysinilytica TaxID=433323 RepID=A0A4R6Q138_9FIRM|nr:regulatory protein RecX [Aminicella lysinilytica]TDP54565.1 SOS response regulatory protein OraA/RecX [Aminicella lysinilytica]
MNIEDTAARKLTERSMSVVELTNYLAKKGFPQEDVSRVIAMLKEDGYLNDSRFCREYFEYAFGRNKGKRRAFAELRKKGVDADVMENAFDDYEAEDDVDFSEERMARAEAAKILRMADLTWDDPVSEKIRGRIARKLDSYGYSSTVIYEILGELKYELR